MLLAGLISAIAPASAQTPTSPTITAAQERPAAPQAPLILLLDGLGVYVESNYIGVSSLARPLQQQGFRTRTDSHLMARTQGLVPDIIIGHSMGGETAMRYAARLVRSGYPAPLIITIDAAPAPPPCPVARCINIAGPGFTRVRGATNISAWAAGARFVNHAQLPTHPAVKQLILQETGSWLSRRKVASAGASNARQSRAKPAQADGTRSSAQAPAASPKPKASAQPLPNSATSETPRNGG